MNKKELIKKVKEIHDLIDKFSEDSLNQYEELHKIDKENPKLKDDIEKGFLVGSPIKFIYQGKYRGTLIAKKLVHRLLVEISK
jgi:hypothetical protein